VILILVDEDNPSCLQRSLDLRDSFNSARQLLSCRLYSFDSAEPYRCTRGQLLLAKPQKNPRCLYLDRENHGASKRGAQTKDI
jgi:hypothetical protein